MRKQFVECLTRYAARKACPWACSIVKATGGFWCFESASDARLFRNQK
jgi:hypothetical protein